LNPQSTGKDGELWTVDAITQVAKTEQVLVEHTKGQWMTTGDPENYFIAHLKFVLEREKYGQAVLQWVQSYKPTLSEV
jgi:UTP-glucose-1-phosphate uridylyltransferase